MARDEQYQGGSSLWPRRRAPLRPDQYPTVIRDTSGRAVHGSRQPIGRALRELIDARFGRPVQSLDFTSCDLSRLVAHQVRFEDCRFAGADLSRAQLIGCTFFGCALPGANLERATLYEARLGYCDLSRANLAGANLRRTRIANSDLIGIRLDGALFLATEFVDVSVSFIPDHPQLRVQA